MPPSAVPSGGLVDVWWFDTRAVTVGPAGLADLDRGERDRAEALLFPADRHRYQVAHVMLRRVLAGYTGTAPGALGLGRERCPRCGAPDGRPGARRYTAPSFSLTHSGERGDHRRRGAAGGRRRGTGAARCVCSLAEALHPADAAWVAGLAEPDRHEAIITCWVRAEAALKCTGQGTGHGLGDFPVRPGSAADHGVNGCTVGQLAAPEGYAPRRGGGTPGSARQRCAGRGGARMGRR